MRSIKMDNWNNFVELNKKHIFSAIIDDNYDDLQNVSRDYISNLESIRKNIIDAVICKESVGGDVPIYKLNDKAFLLYIHLYERLSIHNNYRYKINLKISEHNNQHVPFIIIGNVCIIKIQTRMVSIIQTYKNHTTKYYFSNIFEFLSIIEKVKEHF